MHVLSIMAMFLSTYVMLLSTATTPSTKSIRRRSVLLPKLLILLLSSSATIVAGDPINSCGKETTPAEAFSCLFRNITFSLPNMHIPNIKGKIALDLDNLKCLHLAISELHVGTTSPSPVEHDIAATVEGGTLSCSANIKVSHIPILGSISAAVLFDISSLQFSIKIIMNNKNTKHKELPTNAIVSVPSSNPKPDLSLKLHLDGSLLIKIINFLGHGLLESEIKKVILSALSTKLPSMITPLLDSLVTNVSKIVAPYLDPPSLIPDPSNALPPQIDPIRWDRGLAGTVLGPISKIMADVSEDKIPLISHLIDFVGMFLGWDQGSIQLNINQMIHIGNDGLSSSTNITIQTITVSGLDGLMTGDDLYILDPNKAMLDQKNGSGLQLATKLKFPKISFEMKGIVSLAPGSIVGKGEGSLTAPATVRVDLINVAMDLDALIAIDYHAFKKLSLGQMLSPTCLLQSLAAFNITRLDMQSLLDPKAPPTVTFLSPGIDELMNELIGVVDGLYAQVLSETIRGALAGPIRTVLNDIITKKLSNTTSSKNMQNECLPMPIPSGILPNITQTTNQNIQKFVSLLTSKIQNKKKRNEPKEALMCSHYGTNQQTCDATKGCTFCAGGWAHTHGCYTLASAARLPPGMFQCDNEKHENDDDNDNNNINMIKKEESTTSTSGIDVPLDFGSNPIFTLLFGLLDVVLNIEDKPLKYTINDAINTLTNQTGMLTFNNLYSTGMLVFGNVHANLTLPYVKIRNLNQFQNIDIEASDSDVLSMEMDISAIEIDVGIDLSLLVRPPDGNMLPSLIVTDVYELLEVSLILPSSSRLGSKNINALIDATALAALDVEHLMSSPGCLGETVHTLSLDELILELPNITMKIHCRDDDDNNNNNNNNNDDDDNGDDDDLYNINKVKHNFTTCTSPLQALGVLLDSDVGAQRQLTGLLERVLKAAVNATLGQPVVHLLNDLVESFVSDSSKQCRNANVNIDSSDLSVAAPSSSNATGGNSPAVEPYTGIYIEASIWLGILSCVSFGFAILIGVIMQCQENCGKKSSSVEKAKDTMTSPLLNPTNDEEAEASPATDNVGSDNLAGNASAASRAASRDVALMFHPDVPAYARFSVPFILLSGALMYLSGNINVGASVFVNVNFADLAVPLPSLFDFSLGNSIRDMWSAQVYPLALLILLFSGVWPYVKLVMMFTCWVMPPSFRWSRRCCRCCRGRVLGVARRGMWLQALDALGKWSLIDTFVLVMMMVAFRFHIQNQITWSWITFLPDNFLVVDVIVEPNWGIYAFIIATVVSLISTHVVIAFHRAAADPSLDAQDNSSIAVRRFRYVKELKWIFLKIK